MLAVLVLVLSCLVTPALSNCLTFTDGLCPGSASCKCALTPSSCSLAPPMNRTELDAKYPVKFPELLPESDCSARGGHCYETQTGDCPGSSSCLLAGGACSSPAPPPGPGDQCQPCGIMCCNIPADGLYYLTSFCPKGNNQPLACGGHCGEYNSGYFTADKQRFGCLKKMTVCSHQTGACITATTRDAGPAAWVEKDAGRPVIDASYPVCQKLFNKESCGWSGHNLIHAVPATDEEQAKYEDGEIFYLTLEERLRRGKEFAKLRN
eukprot:TRINITY_DN61600_c0_g1_i2.p1 TRINITY_DN61600_c0_g1~~TRINITY_DN61600_c0_g1_i2.p1  ORF type:complete len:265 (-),score=10.31 TRINITY_DN61600_c0_g1_i2:655-1449(-)